ncbi:MAG: hypothetical protein PHQ35_02035 [Phycisphaerae bacterium]|nr:hypothetical protein [Phycisphaerae bacterium]MDD5380424.1 hypothetical protein [Phycisphaerae bacterium]
MTDTANSSRLSQRLFNPFRFMAGFQALLLGLAIILLSSFIGSISNTHFDGVLDVHTGAAAPMWFFLVEGMIDWICMVIPLFFFGLIVSRSSFRVIDVLGTQALARWPYLIAAVAMIPDANRRVLEHIVSKVAQTAPAAISSIDVFVFGFAMIVLILMMIWMVVLMYRAYTVSCNIKGAAAIVTFVVSLIGAEVLSKFAILLLVRTFS